LSEIDCGDGVLRELARGDWGQLTMRTVRPGCEAGGHRHPNTAERWWVVRGRAVVTLDNGLLRTELRPHFDETLRVGAGVWHSIRNEGDEDVILVYWSDKVYEEQEKVI
jgi:mannose-6-phosphate isomerase-like protein (cupin superfamily)